MRSGTPLPSLDGVERWYNQPPAAHELDGHPTLVHFWSVSCGLCKEALPKVNEWRTAYEDRGLKVVGVHQPRSEADLEREPVEAIIHEHRLEHPQAADDDYILVDRFENKFVPAYYIFDREGKLRHFQAGDAGVQMIDDALVRVVGLPSG